MKVKEAIELINNSENQYCIKDAEKLLRKAKKIFTNWNVEKHKYYDISSNIYKMEDGEIEVRGISKFKHLVFNKPDDYKVRNKVQKIENNEENKQ